MPPAPIGEVISYGPNQVPGVRSTLSDPRRERPDYSCGLGADLGRASSGFTSRCAERAERRRSRFGVDRTVAFRRSPLSRCIVAKDRSPPTVAVRRGGAKRRLAVTRSHPGAALISPVHHLNILGGRPFGSIRVSLRPRYPIPRCETSKVSAALGALLPAAPGRFAAGGPPGADPSRGATASAVPASGSHGRHH